MTRLYARLLVLLSLASAATAQNSDLTGFVRDPPDCR
jgi:hypothetical protein